MLIMRTITFRGKTPSGEWIYGDFVHPNIIQNPEFKSTWKYCIDNTIGQFTGLFDTNGTEIYEGDILRHPPESDWDKENWLIEQYDTDGKEVVLAEHLNFITDEDKRNMEELNAKCPIKRWHIATPEEAELCNYFAERETANIENLVQTANSNLKGVMDLLSAEVKRRKKGKYNANQ